jgi:hypothetical protein
MRGAVQVPTKSSQRKVKIRQALSLSLTRTFPAPSGGFDRTEEMTECDPRLVAEDLNFPE